MKRKCLRKSCDVEFEPNKPKQLFCSAKCRVYHSRDKKKNSPELPIPKKEPVVLKEKSTEPKSDAGLTSFQIYQRKKLGLK